jgi:tRNA (mo5U34)-methyltransferase
MTLQSMGNAHAADDVTGRAIAGLAPWFHNLHLPGGVETAPDHPLGDFPSFKWAQIGPHLPEDLAGRRVLDIGCNAGFYAFELAARGASVLAMDMDEHYLEQGRWAAARLDPEGRVEFRRMQVYDLVDVDEVFDVVLFLGVLYHLRYPQLALDLVTERVGGQLILQTLTMPGDPPVDVPADVPIDGRDALTAPGWPRAAFIERSMAGDPSNWWAPDDACVHAMLRSAGLRVTATPGHEIYVCEPDPEHDEAAALRIEELRAATRR